MKEIYQLVVIGINHKTSTIAEREKLQISKKEVDSALKFFNSMTEIEGTIIVPTCNRLEFYFSLKQDTDPFSIIYDFYHKRGIRLNQERRKLFYTYRGIEAAKHLFKVISGLDSMLIGEYQIQGQVKDAYSLACSAKTTGKILHKLFHSAFHTGKKVRTHTKIGRGNQSLSGIAFNIIDKNLLPEDTITIIGVNQNSKILADNLQKSGYHNLNFVNRTLSEAKKLTGTFGGYAYDLKHLEKAAVGSSCIFSCTGAPGYIMNSELINSLYNRTGKLKLIVDMAVPHDIDARGLNQKIEFVDIDKLQDFMDQQRMNITSDIPKALDIIDDEAKIFEAWEESQNNEKVYLAEEKVEAIRLQLINEIKPSISEHESELLDKFSRSLIHRMKSIINESVRMSSGSSVRDTLEMGINTEVS